MKESSEKAMEVNNEQQGDKTFKVNSDIDDADKVQEITAARTPMKKNKPVCVTCNQTFAMENWFKNISRKST